MSGPEALLARVPDDAVHVEARGLLLRGDALVVAGDDDAFLVFDPRSPCVMLVGPPGPWLSDALGKAGRRLELLVEAADVDEAAAWLPAWRRVACVAHLHPAPDALPVPAHRTGPIDPLDERLRRTMGDELAEELPRTAVGRPSFAAFEGELPVALAYSYVESETLFDLSIDTAPTHRRRGFATAAAAALVRAERARGLAPVWGTTLDNAGSLAVARRLGFVEAGRMTAFVSPEG